jgi:EAL domain-containing protein (putative c-di-GMP-specific phosphodiesterase class I)
MLDSVFIGGSTEFKLGRTAASIARQAKRRGKHLHGGRVNTRQRFRYMAELGCDSIDGSGFSKWSAERIPMALRWLEELERQPSLLAA